MSAEFNVEHKKAFVELGALSTRGWSAFDVHRDKARQGKANLFVITIWNYQRHTDEHGNKYAVPEPKILKDVHDRTLWYVMNKPTPDTEDKSWKAHWDGLAIAINQGLPIKGFLKDAKTGLCSVTHQFDCKTPSYEKIGGSMWLQLDPRPGNDIDFEVRLDDIQQIIDRELSLGSTVESTPTDDLQEITRQETTKERLVDARVGQGRFRSEVLKEWGHRCAVTGSEILTVIRASHIKPWCHSSNTERLDPQNGLPLIASLDALFDAGLISFDPEGKMVVSDQLPTPEREIFSINNCKLKMPLREKTAEFLEYHRQHVFRK